MLNRLGKKKSLTCYCTFSLNPFLTDTNPSNHQSTWYPCTFPGMTPSISPVALSQDPHYSSVPYKSALVCCYAVKDFIKHKQQICPLSIEQHAMTARAPKQHRAAYLASPCWLTRHSMFNALIQTRHPDRGAAVGPGEQPSTKLLMP